MKAFFTAIFLVAACTCSAAQYKGDQSPSENFDRLMAGNKRFIEGNLEHPSRDQERRIKTAIAQKPFAIVLSCSDSRVAPEIIFDEGLGDLFVVRVAGNVVGPIELASIEYSAVHLGSNILMIMGHENCGAVTAVVEGQTEDIEPIAELIAPAVTEAKAQKGSVIENAIKDNVQHVVAQVEAVPALASLIKQKKLAVVGSYYELASGKVEILTPIPQK